VPRENEGATWLRQGYGQEEWFAEARRKAHARARDPQRRAKIAASRRGRPRPPGVLQAMQSGRLGKPLSEEHRHKLSETHRRRGTRPPKAGRPRSAAEGRLVRTLPPAEAARRTGRTVGAVYGRRHALGLSGARKR